MPRRGYRQRPEHIQRRPEKTGQTIAARYGGITRPSVLNSALLESAEARHRFMANMCAYADMVSDDLDTLREIANSAPSRRRNGTTRR